MAGSMADALDRIDPSEATMLRKLDDTGNEGNSPVQESYWTREALALADLVAPETCDVAAAMGLGDLKDFTDDLAEIYVAHMEATE